MAYFDSPKNSAMWEKEMTGLRAERDRRQNEGFKPASRENTETKMEKSAKQNDPRHRAITLKELEEIEAKMGGVRRVKRPTRVKARSMEMKQGEKSSAPKQRGL
ncbi:MAG: hypothetical protein J6U50_07815 [Lachnospiraceae bacterium]|nr:hypothetical protein [Lachnospiraceae bacterium]